jgi:hypothetical protein
MKKRKEEQKKSKQEGKQIREAKIEEAVKRKDNANASSKGAVNLATSVSRGSKTRSPPKTAKEPPRESSSSMEDCTW